MCNIKMTPEEAFDGFMKGIDCSQAVFAEFAPDLGLDKETAMKIAAAFGGGMSEGETCGAVTGALMAIGLKYGQGDNTDLEKKNEMIEKVMRFKNEFAESYGSCICKDILGLKVPEDMEQILALNKFGTVCNRLVVEACEICERILNED